MQPWCHGVGKLRRQPARSLVQSRGDVQGTPRHAGVVARADDRVAKLHAEPSMDARHDLDPDQFVISDGRGVSHVGFEDGEQDAFFLKREERGADGAEELAAGLLEEVEEARVVDVVPEGALGVGHAVGVSE